MTRINTNVPSLVAQNRLNQSNADLQTSLTRLSTGLRINSGKDDPAGLIASEALRSDITGISKAISNTQRASQIIATADSALGEVSSLLNDVRGLVVEAANNGALSDDEIAANQLQIDSSLEAINRIAQTTTFQGRRLLDGSLDFITQGGTGYGTVNDIKIDQANLGASGTISVDVAVSAAATQASITSSGIPASTTAVNSSGTVTFGSPSPDGEAVLDVDLDAAYTIGEEVNATLAVTGTTPNGEASGTLTLTNGFAFDIDVRDGSVADGTFGNDTNIVITTQASGTNDASYDANTNTLSLTLTRDDSADAVVADLALDADVNTIFDFTNGTTTAQASNNAIALVGASDFTLDIAAAAGGQADGVIGNATEIRVTTSAAGGSTAATYDANTNTLDITLEEGLNAAAINTALDGSAAAVAGDFVFGAGGAGNVGNDDGSTFAPGTLAGGAFGNVTAGDAGTYTSVLSGGTDTTATGNIVIEAVDGQDADGAFGNDTSVIFTSGGAANTASAAFNAATNELTVTVGAGATIQQIADAVNTTSDFTASNVTNGDYEYSTAFNGDKGVLGTTAGSITTNTAGTNPIAAGAFRLTAIDGTATDGTTGNDTTISFTRGAANTLSYDADANQLDIEVAEDATVEDIYDLINAATGSDRVFIASDLQNGTSIFDRRDAPTGNAEVITPTEFVSGTDTVVNDIITVSASDASADWDGVTVNITGSNGLAEGQATATYDADNQEINVTVSTNGTGVAIGTIATAINDLADFDASVTTNDGDGVYLSGTDTAPSVVDLAGGVFGGGLTGDLVVQLSGSKGSEVLQFDRGATLASVIQSVNLVSDATGVSATDEAGVLRLTSSDYGSDALVAVEVISEGDGGTFESGLSAPRQNGTDIVATVNGTQATGEGNTLSINTATLDLNVTVDAGSSTDFSFDITGGGALFQLGPDVASNQQARLGIGSLNTAKLGGATGRLYELGSGQSKSLTNDVNGAAEVVEEVINKVTNLRGRLGAFQATTLESNLVSLNDTLANLQQAESSIRDADFAAESANLTRAQILVQSGTNVLALANQNPQNVLSLLR